MQADLRIKYLGLIPVCMSQNGHEVDGAVAAATGLEVDARLGFCVVKSYMIHRLMSG